MQIAVIECQPGLSQYVVEIFKTWGAPLCRRIKRDALAALNPTECPVLIIPAGADFGVDDCVAYTHRGGTTIAFLPGYQIANQFGMTVGRDKPAPLRLRITGMRAAGVAGELLPIVGLAKTYEMDGDKGRVLAFLCYPDRFEDETAGIVEVVMGRGRFVAFSFDLLRCVLLLRQGDPTSAEWIPDGDACARASHMSCDIGPRDAGWLPFADLMAKLLVDIVAHRLNAPLPLLSQMPGNASGIVLFSGDEDGVDVSTSNVQFDQVTSAGGRMTLYIIPGRTKSTASDVQRYVAQHDVGPHPNLQPLARRPVAERLADYERQVHMFEEMYHIKPLTVRNHRLAWAGYMDMPQLQANLGIRMDANYLGDGSYGRFLDNAPYAAFGAALPMRFCHPDGHLINVYQQHTHVEDDLSFHLTKRQSRKLSPSCYADMLDRCMHDIATRFHTPYAANFHPANWVRYSSPPGMELLRQASRRKFPVWSFDQWCRFWECRDTWRYQNLQWDGATLTVVIEGTRPHRELTVLLPLTHNDTRLSSVSMNGTKSSWGTVTRWAAHFALVVMPKDKSTVVIQAGYLLTAE